MAGTTYREYNSLPQVYSYLYRVWVNTCHSDPSLCHSDRSGGISAPLAKALYLELASIHPYLVLDLSPGKCLPRNSYLKGLYHANPEKGEIITTQFSTL